ncbi:hypothetical protein D3C71_1490590 [compost metagenome]
MQKFEAHAVPFPGVASHTIRRALPAQPRWCVQPGHWQRCLNCGHAASVIVVAMTDHQAIQSLHAQCPQRRHHHPLTGIKAVAYRRPRVVQQGVVLRAYQHRQSLADIHHRQLELALGRQFTPGHQQRQPQQQRERLGGHAARQQHP